jgi:hypothetical protein
VFVPKNCWVYYQQNCLAKEGHRREEQAKKITNPP